MGLSRRQFTREFKLAALQRLEAGASVAEVARAFEVNPNVRIPTEADHYSGLIAITVPGPSRSLIGDGRNRDRDASESPVEKSLAALDTKVRVAWSSERRSRCP